MAFTGTRILVVESSGAEASRWCSELRAQAAEVDHRERAGKGLEALLLGAVTPRPHNVVVLGPSVAPSMRDAFAHTLVGALSACRLVVLDAARPASGPPEAFSHGFAIGAAAPNAVVRATAAALGRPLPSSAHDTSTGTASAPLILLVEDNPVNREVAENALEAGGLLVDSVFDGKQALEAVLRKEYAAVVMDIQMPVMDGLTATRLIRARPEAVHSIPIIAMTANVLPSHREAAAAAGMDGFVEKPIKPDVLLQTLYAAMRGESDFRTRPARSASTAPVLDLQVLANLKATFGPALVRVQATLARDAPRRLERMQAAVQTGDFNTLRREAHSLKSSSGTFGLTRVSQLSKDIEFACSEGRHKSALQSLEQLSTSLHPDLDLLARHMD